MKNIDLVLNYIPECPKCGEDVYTPRYYDQIVLRASCCCGWYELIPIIIDKDNFKEILNVCVYHGTYVNYNIHILTKYKNMSFDDAIQLIRL